MSKQPEHNKLDFFKEQFDEKSNQDLGWNNPPDFVFEDALAVVNRRKNKRKNRFLLFLSIFGILGAVILSHLYTTYKFNNLEEKIELLSQNKKLENYSTKQHTDSDSKEEIKGLNANSNAVTSLGLTETKDIPKVNITTNHASTSTSHTEVGTNTIAPIKVKQFLAHSTAVTTQKTAIENSSSILKAKASKNINTIPLRLKSDKLLPIPTFLKSITTLPSKPIAINDIEKSAFENIKQSKTIALGLLINRNNSTFEMQGLISPEQSLTRYDDYYTGLGLKASVSYPLSNRFSINGNLSYDKVHNQSTATSGLEYATENEKINDIGNLMYETMMYLESPVGTLEQPMLFEVNHLMPRAGSMINEKTEIDQCLSIIGFSTGLNYQLTNRERFSWNVGVNLGANYISNLLSNMDSEFTLDNVTVGEYSNTVESTHDLNKFFGSAGISTSFDIVLRKNYSLTLGADYSKSISSLRNSDTTSTNLINWSTSIGVKRFF